MEKVKAFRLHCEALLPWGGWFLVLGFRQNGDKVPAPPHMNSVLLSDLTFLNLSLLSLASGDYIHHTELSGLHK